MGCQRLLSECRRGQGGSGGSRLHPHFTVQSYGTSGYSPFLYFLISLASNSPNFLSIKYLSTSLGLTFSFWAIVASTAFFSIRL